MEFYEMKSHADSGLVLTSWYYALPFELKYDKVGRIYVDVLLKKWCQNCSNSSY